MKLSSNKLFLLFSPFCSSFYSNLLFGLQIIYLKNCQLYFQSRALQIGKKFHNHIHQTQEKYHTCIINLDSNILENSFSHFCNLDTIYIFSKKARQLSTFQHCSQIVRFCICSFFLICRKTFTFTVFFQIGENMAYSDNTCPHCGTTMERE